MREFTKQFILDKLNRTEDEINMVSSFDEMVWFISPIVYRTWSDKDPRKWEAFDMFIKGSTYREIGEAFAVNGSTVQQWLIKSLRIVRDSKEFRSKYGVKRHTGEIIMH